MKAETMMRTNELRHVRSMVAILLLSTIVITGCGKAPSPWEIAHPIKGKVLFKGKPVANADISLFPLDESVPDSVRPRAKSGEDGTFVVWTYAEGDGAPAGSYKMTIVRNEVAISKGAVVAKPNDLPKRYSQLATTDLLVEVVPGQVEIEAIELK